MLFVVNLDVKMCLLIQNSEQASASFRVEGVRLSLPVSITRFVMLLICLVFQFVIHMCCVLFLFYIKCYESASFFDVVLLFHVLFCIKCRLSTFNVFTLPGSSFVCGKVHCRKCSSARLNTMPHLDWRFVVPCLFS